MNNTLSLVIVGGCGRVGLPLALAFARTGLRIGVYDIDVAKVELVRSGRMPFIESGAQELLEELLPTGRLEFSADSAIISRTDTVVMVIGTPIDEFMNPSTRVFEKAVDGLHKLLRPNGLVILRSTVYPGTTHFVHDRLAAMGANVDLVFCPERIAEGYAFKELSSLPQLIGATNDSAYERAAAIFRRLGVEIVRTTPLEAELTKLFNNTWRYVKFAVANQFFQIAHQAGADYNTILKAIRHNYPRGSDLPAPGFAAGPCLLKDTMQLVAYSPDHFPLGHAAVQINEGLPNYVVDVLERRYSLKGRTLGILGMAFKGESDDPRTSLSYKLRKLAIFRGATVLCSDPFIYDPSFLPHEGVIQASDILIIGAPHSIYKGIDVGDRPLVDIWGLTGRGITL